MSPVLKADFLPSEPQGSPFGHAWYAITPLPGMEPVPHLVHGAPLVHQGSPPYDYAY